LDRAPNQNASGGCAIKRGNGQVGYAGARVERGHDLDFRCRWSVLGVSTQAVKLVGIGLLVLGAVRLYAALKGSFTAPMAGGFVANVELEPPTASSKAMTIGVIGVGLFLVLK
jgi:hypothetical protein